MRWSRPVPRRRACPGRRTPNVPGFNRTLLPPELGRRGGRCLSTTCPRPRRGHSSSRLGGPARVRTGDLRPARATRYQLRHKPIVEDARVERAASRSQSGPGHRAGHPRPAQPAGICSPTGWAFAFMPSTVEFSMIVTAGLPGCSHGRQELNPQPTALETAALPVELRPYGSYGDTRNAARSRCWVGGVRASWIALVAPPIQVGAVAVQVDGSPGYGRAHLTAQRAAPRFDRGVPQHPSAP